MMEITAIGMGLMMTAVSVLVGGIVLEGTLLMLTRALRRAALLTESFPAAAIDLS